MELRANLVRLTRYLAVIEIYNPTLVLRTSEVVSDFKIVVRNRTVYSGRGVVRSLMNTGLATIGEVTLTENCWSDVEVGAEPFLNGHLKENFAGFLAEWQKLYKVLPEFKVAIADMQSFLSDLRGWLNQIELEMRAISDTDQIAMELQIAHEIGTSVVPAFSAMHERLESISAKVEEEFRPSHQIFASRLLHPLVMCSPFAFRTFQKPLGYAGDYEMVNMIVRDPYEGNSLYAKVVNLWFLKQWPSEAHRNRIIYLKGTLVKESLRAKRLGRPLRVLNLGCGPAWEIQQFLKEQEIASECIDFTLLDFNPETIEYAQRVLGDIKRQHNRRTKMTFLKKSVHHVLKDTNKPEVIGNGPGDARKYDLIYCAGLFDYLSDRTCKQLMNLFYRDLEPNGLLAATNVDDCKPFRHMLEFVLDWHLIYRNVQKGARLLPDRAIPDLSSVVKDPSEVNIFIETRKPADA